MMIWGDKKLEHNSSIAQLSNRLLISKLKETMQSVVQFDNEKTFDVFCQAVDKQLQHLKENDTALYSDIEVECYQDENDKSIIHCKIKTRDQELILMLNESSKKS